MMIKQFLNVKKASEGVLMIELNRPDRRNAMNIGMMEDLVDVFEGLQQQSVYRAVIITGVGGTFCSGIDPEEMIERSISEKIPQHMAHVLTSIYHSHLVTIAAIDGHATAEGAGLVAACDFATMAKDAKIGFPEIRAGFVAAQVAIVLRRQIAMRHVRQLLLSGELINGQRAFDIGLVNRIVDHELLMDSTMELAQSVILGGAEAIKETKHLLDNLDPRDFYHDMELAISYHAMFHHSIFTPPKN